MVKIDISSLITYTDIMHKNANLNLTKMSVRSLGFYTIQIKHNNKIAHIGAHTLGVEEDHPIHGGQAWPSR